MITEEEYQKALDIVRAYQIQVNDTANRVNKEVASSTSRAVKYQMLSNVCIEDLNFSVRIFTAIKAAGIKTTQELLDTGLEYDTLSKWRGISEKTYTYLIQCLDDALQYELTKRPEQ